ncbi:YdcF family protein [Peptostreptococcus faecalis]|uniref:YdcF family protein n=1 Tax=Peptostreptococcus faecalis TaxID=2045015 RepID=UPI000C7CE531|nr:YdcF family protein [Peptostreptococcus faecalis]
MLNSFRILKLFILFSLIVFIFLESVIFFGGRDNHSKDSKYIIVLGAKLHGSRPSKSLLYRMETALEYMKRHPKTILIATGGQGSDETIPESKAISDYFIKNGIDKSRILTENKSTNTFENLKFARKLISQNGNIKVNIVSNRYHLFRAKLLASRNGFEPYSIPAKTPKSVILQSYLRESLALIKSYLLDR